MLEPADLLLLDEPTNDLDIPTLEILEESLLEFSGALVLVTHDRYLLDRVSTVVLGLDGQGGAERFADYSQWDTWQSERRKASKTATVPVLAPVIESAAAPITGLKKKLSYLDAREYETIEHRIAEAEKDLAAKHAVMEDPAVMRDAMLLDQAYQAMQTAQREVDLLYARWAELTEKLDSIT